MTLNHPLAISFQVLSMLLAFPLLASELSQMRLFYSQEVPGLTANTSQKSVKPVEITDAFAAKPEKKVSTVKQNIMATGTTPINDKAFKLKESKAYRYNGYISSDTGTHYFINGRPLEKLDSHELVSVIHEGRVLELRNSKGAIFRVTVGQTW